MQYLYLLSLIILFISLLLIKKSSEKQNILVGLLLSTVILMSYTSLICFILSMIRIPINILTMLIFNLIAILIIFINIKNENKRQKYYFNKFDIITILTIVILCSIVFMFMFSSSYIKAESPDGAAHFLSARTFALNTSLKMKSIAHGQNTFDKFQFFGMVNLGMIYKILPNLNTFDQYKIYSIFNIFMMFLSSISFYILLKDRYKSKKRYALSLFITILYTLGYPLVTINYGFLYWGISSIIICSIITCCDMYTSKYSNKYLVMILLSLLTFGLFCCYYLLVPIVYLAMFIFIINYYIKTKEISKLDVFNFVVITLLIPFAFGMIYFLMDSIFSVSKIVKTTTQQGTNYKNLINNFILILPFAMHGYTISRKNKNNFIHLLSIICIIFIFNCFAFMYFNVMSSYYFYKLYSILWIVLWYFTFISLENLLKNYKVITYGFCGIYIFLLLLITIDFDSKVDDKAYDSGFSLENSCVDIYNRNITSFRDKENIILNNNELEGIKYVIEHKDKLVGKNNEMAVMGAYMQRRWFDTLTDIIPKIDYTGNLIEYYEGFTLEEWENMDYDYLVIFDYDEINSNKNKYEKYEVEFENKDMIIIRK